MIKNDSDVYSDVKKWFTAEELAVLNLPGYPRTSRRWHDRAVKDGWLERQVPSQGRTGFRREYTPPPEVQALIDARQRGEQPITPVRQPVSKRAAPVEVTEDDYVDLIPPKIGGAAAKCPGCGAFIGFLKIEGRVQLEFDSPGAITLMIIMAKLQPVFKGDPGALYDLSLRAYAVLSLLTTGNEESINDLLSKPNLISTLAAFCEELNATPPHNHAPPEAKT